MKLREVELHQNISALRSVIAHEVWPPARREALLASVPLTSDDAEYEALAHLANENIPDDLMTTSQANRLLVLAQKLYGEGSAARTNKALLRELELLFIEILAWRDEKLERSKKESA